MRILSFTLSIVLVVPHDPADLAVELQELRQAAATSTCCDVLLIIRVQTLSVRNIGIRNESALEVGFDLSRSPGFVVGQLAKAMTSKLAGRFGEHGLTVPQWVVLACLWREDGLTQTQLCERANVDASTLTELLKRMAAKGYVRRERDERNNRLQRVYLLDAQTELRDATAAAAVAVNEQALHGFSPADRARLIRLLGRALANLNDEEVVPA